MQRAILAAVVVAAVALGGYAWLSAGQAAGPAIEIRQPVRFVGRTATFEATVDTPDGELTALEAFIDQDGAHPLFALDAAGDTDTRQESATRLRLLRRFDRESHPALRAGAATVVVRATRPVLFGLREATSEASVEVAVRLDPPRLTPLSRFPLRQSRRGRVHRLPGGAGRCGSPAWRSATGSTPATMPPARESRAATACGSPSSRSRTTRTSAPPCGSTPATRPATRRGPPSTTGSSSAGSGSRASRWASASCGAWCRVSRPARRSSPTRT